MKPNLYLRWALACIGVLLVMDLLCILSVTFLDKDYVFGLISLFQLGSEANIPTWFSSVNLLYLSLCIYQARVHLPAKAKQAWALIAFTIFLSMDETAEIHEKVSHLLARMIEFHPLLRYPWVVAGLFFFIAFAWLLLNLCAGIPRRFRRVITTGVLVYFSSCLGLEVVEGVWAHYHGEGHVVYQLLMTLEEIGEILGVTLMAYGFGLTARAPHEGTEHETQSSH